MADEYERMPGNRLIQYSELRKFKEAKDFVISDENGNDVLIEYNESILRAYNYYFQIWDNCHTFGLPFGGDWTKCPPWLVSFVKMFNQVFVEIENYRDSKRNK